MFLEQSSLDKSLGYRTLEDRDGDTSSEDGLYESQANTTQ